MRLHVHICESALSNSVTQTSEGVAGDECYFSTLCDINPVNTRHKISDQATKCVFNNITRALKAPILPIKFY